MMKQAGKLHAIGETYKYNIHCLLVCLLNISVMYVCVCLALVFYLWLAVNNDFVHLLRLSNFRFLASKGYYCKKQVTDRIIMRGP